jgi:L-alanine-DL-glutamate epimerase-like enolase superfamily enzyme
MQKKQNNYYNKMKIQSVKTKLYQWQGPVKTGDTIFATPLSALPFQSDAQAPFRFFSWLVVEIKTDEGHVWLRQCRLCPDLCKQIVDTKLSGLLLDENPLNTEYLFEKMFRSTIAYGRKGAVLAAISAIDIALWDIKGLVMNQPVFMLLGGRTKPAILPTIAACTHVTWKACMRKRSTTNRKALPG